MPNQTASFAAVLAGGVFVYSAITHKRIIDVLLNRPSTLPQSSTTTNTNPPNFSGGNPAGSIATIRSAIAAAAIMTLSEPAGTYSYAEVRPYPSSLFSGKTPIVTDCSGFATLCYKAAGAPDPNGENYDGQGYTGTLEAHGTPTTNPQPGDLAFWSTPDHVTVYVGGGRCVGFGGGSAPIEDSINQESTYHAAFLGFRTYPMG